jgi:serine/threonine-protein kinase
MSDDVWTPTEGELVADRFRLVRELDRGGMGSVWVAEHEALQVPCAVKFIHEDAQVTEDHRSRFRQEALAAARLKSRYVVQMLDHGVWKDAPYIAMELLEGELLSTRLRQLKKLTAVETLDVVRGVARALASAAELGIVHRDLKPENIFLVSEAGEEYPKVLDFGVAKLTVPDLGGSHRTKTGALIGTPWYMSPEQIDGTLAVDHRSDLWALSVITFQCLTGELPFQSTALGNLMLKIVNGPRPVPSEIAPELGRAFDAWWMRAAERDPDARFQSADGWLLALEEALSMPHQPASEGEEAIELDETGKVAAEEEDKGRGEATFAGQARSERRASPPPGKAGRVALVGLLFVAAFGSVALLFWRRDETEIDAAPPAPVQTATASGEEEPEWQPPSSGPAAEPWLEESAEPEASASAAASADAEPPDAGMAADAGIAPAVPKSDASAPPPGTSSVLPPPPPTD